MGPETAISWEAFQQSLLTIRETVNKVAQDSRQYDSYNDIRDDLVKNKRCNKGPMQIYKHPMTTQQAIGWHEEDVYNERFPKSSCDETRYADALVKSGWKSGGLYGAHFFFRGPPSEAVSFFATREAHSGDAGTRRKK